ncbi:aspartate aminotransferase family protein [Brevibacterium luteolum]|uniref:class-III pyridoxal-phosphate-dependent aminotransferase n=1 Tax=Brevibacterium luteolum TaxID=199591 RepID=UPI003EE9CA43
MRVDEITPEQRITEEAAYARDQAVLAHIQNLRFFPLTVSGGSGARLRTASGRELIDLSASWTASSFGHGNPTIAEAVHRAALTGAGSSALSAAVAGTTKLAERLLNVVPVKYPERVYLGLSGSDANIAAVEAARRATGRPNIVSFSGSYHGGFGTSRDISGIAESPGPGAIVFTYPLSETSLSELRPLLLKALESGTVAAVITEAIQCDGGVRVPDADFLPMLREFCDLTGTLLILDEVKTGLTRTGSLFAFETASIRPDIVTLGKSLGGGLPMSAAVGSEAVLDVAPASALLTNAGAPICAAAADTVLGLATDSALAKAVDTLGSRARQRITDYCGSNRAGATAITEVRGSGLLLGVELRSSESSPLTDAQVAALTIYRAWELGVVVYVVRDNVLEISPPLPITSGDIDRGIEIVLRALDDAVSGRVPTEVLDRFAGW